MASYSNYVKGGELLIDPTMKCKDIYVLKCCECGKYFDHLDKFVSHCIGHFQSKSSVDVWTPPATVEFMPSGIAHVDYRNTSVVEDQEGFTTAKADTHWDYDMVDKDVSNDTHSQNLEANVQEVFTIIKEEPKLDEYCNVQGVVDLDANNEVNNVPFDTNFRNVQINTELKKGNFAGSLPYKENIACENCKRLDKKVDGLQESINVLNRTVLSALSEIKVVTTNLVRQEATITVATTDFPIRSHDMLQAIEDSICPDNHALYVSAISKQWRNSLGKNLESVLHATILMSYNIDGTHGKHRLKDFKKFYSALLDSIMVLPSTSNKDPEQLLRHAMQLNKKKQFRQQSVNSKKALETEEMDS